MDKEVKFKVGDILYWRRFECSVIILSRWDRTSAQRVTWMCKVYPNGEKEFPALESELEDIS